MLGRRGRQHSRHRHIVRQGRVRLFQDQIFEGQPLAGDDALAGEVELDVDRTREVGADSQSRRTEDA